MKRHEENELDLDDLDDQEPEEDTEQLTDSRLTENKSKREIKIEKHVRLVKYLEEQQLRKALEFIDDW